MRLVFLHTTSVCMTFVGAWMCALVIFYLWPMRSPSLLVWSLLAGAAFGSVWVGLRPKRSPAWRRVQLTVGLVLMLFGATAVYAQEIRGRATGQWDAYLAIIGLLFIVHGLSLVWHGAIIGKK